MLLEFPPDYYRYVSHLPTRITQEMYIMADLSSDIPNDAADLSPLYMGNEEILCKITIDSNGLLRCKPDFTRGSVKYKIKSKQKGLICYWQMYTLRVILFYVGKYFTSNV